MMSLFPTPYPGEILYSVIARYRIRSGNMSHRSTLRDVFGSDDFTASLELQPGISNLIANLPVGSMLTAEQLIKQNTMYLYYTAFRSKEQAHGIYEEMLQTHGRDMHNQIGIMSSSVKPQLFFQFCPLCRTEDLRIYGELFWRRIHQIPGVRICEKHGVWLNSSNVPIRGANKYVFTAASMENCPADPIRVVPTRMFERYCSLVNDIERLLNGPYPNRPQEWFHRCYKYHLIQVGYATERGRVDHKRLQHDFKEFYGEELLDLLQCSADGNSNWLRLIFQKHRKGFTPIRHLAVLNFLGLKLDDVFLGDESSDQLEITSKNPKTAKPKRRIMKKNMLPTYKQQAKKERREAWLKLINENPQLGRLQLRKINPKLYAWLYLYDREFLTKHLPEPLAPSAGYIRINWEERDQSVLKQVEVAVELFLKQEEKPKRISLQRIQEAIGKQCLMQKHLKKMPLTNAYLEVVVEDSERFRERRIQWAIEELKKEGEPLKAWRIIRKAGINKVKIDADGICVE